MNALIITFAVFGVPMLLALGLYACEAVANTIKAHLQRRAVSKRLDNLR